ncbi:MAG: tetratricopeptide repeat protein, partial [Caldilineaceae bacterium]|nr:tetratricopeptide repeat protein [Caldilineaceae bacterium]
GMGKTRLALQAAEQMVALPAADQPFRDGIFFVPLESVRDDEGLLTAVIGALTTQRSFPTQGDAAVAEQVIHFLRDKALLLVLDNFEHLLSAATLLSDLLLAAPQLKLLVTSRESLGLQEAWFYPVLGLAMTDGTAGDSRKKAENDAVRLFVQCARRTRLDFDVEKEREAVLRICTLVEGMPLAIELAAAWLNAMNCAQIAEEVTRGLDILTTRYQNIPPRQRSMRVVMEHSWALLTPVEREALAQLAIFRGPFSQEAAKRITNASLVILITLAEKALVRMTAAGYYQLHELTRQYAEEQLGDAVKVGLHDSHAHYYAELLERQRTYLFTNTVRQAWTTMGAELDNIRHAWLWLIEAAGAGSTDLPLPTLFRQMVEMLTAYHLYHLLWLPGQALFDQACRGLTAAGWADDGEQIDGETSRRAVLLRLQISAAQFQLEVGHYRASLASAEELLPACRQAGVVDDLFRCLLLYAHTQVRRGHRAEAIPAFEEALALAQHLPSPRYRAEALIGLGMIASADGRYAAAQEYYEQGLAVCQEMDYRPWIARIMTNLGFNHSRQEQP